MPELVKRDLSKRCPPGSSLRGVPEWPASGFEGFEVEVGFQVQVHPLQSFASCAAGLGLSGAHPLHPQSLSPELSPQMRVTVVLAISRWSLVAEGRASALSLAVTSLYPSLHCSQGGRWGAALGAYGKVLDCLVSCPEQKGNDASVCGTC